MGFWSSAAEAGSDVTCLLRASYRSPKVHSNARALAQCEAMVAIRNNSGRLFLICLFFSPSPSCPLTTPALRSQNWSLLGLRDLMHILCEIYTHTHNPTFFKLVRGGRKFSFIFFTLGLLKKDLNQSGGHIIKSGKGNVCWISF